MATPLDISEEKHALLAKVASLYYEKELTQAEIADRLNISRPQVSRLLTEGRQTGVVKIIIQHPTDVHAALRQEVLERFNLQEIFIQNTGHLGYAQVTERLGALAARHLENLLQDGMILGLSWNTGVYQVVRALQAARQRKVTVVQLTGTVGSIDPILDGPDLIRWLAQTLGGRYKDLPAPLVVESASTRQALLQNRSIQESLTLLEGMDVALIGIGSMQPPLSSMLRTGYINENDLMEIVRKGGVGDICGYHYNLKGEVLPLELHSRLIAVSLETLRKTPWVIGVAGGIDKASAILGALRLGVINCLVTDDIALKTVLKISEKN